MWGSTPSWGISPGLTDTTHEKQIRTRLCGVISVGPVGAVNRQRKPLILANAPTTLIYDASAHDGVSFIGALPRPQPDPSDDEIWNYDTTGRAPYDIYREYAETNFHLSSAPLRGVILAEVFQRGQRPECRGILLTYKDGSKRTVGDCRLGIDPSQRFERPDRLCVAVGGEENRRPGIPRPFYVKVRFQNGAARVKGWKTSKMEGHIYFWFTANLHYVEVISEKSSR